MLGFYNVIKPTGVSSGFIVNRIKKITGQKVGHLGTLDPLASGVLPIAVGKATRFFDYFLDKDKRYIAVAKFGVETTSLDAEGSIVGVDNKKIQLKEVELAAKSLVGKSFQMPPKFSAKMVDGVRAYAAALKDKDFNLQPKEVEIYSIEVSKGWQDDLFLLDIHCKSGTYVRSIVRDIAYKLKTCATTVAIIRTKSGKFCIDQAVTIEELENSLDENLIKINSILQFPIIEINARNAKDLLSGKEISINERDGEYLTLLGGEEFSIVECVNGKAKNKIYLNERESL